MGACQRALIVMRSPWERVVEMEAMPNARTFLASDRRMHPRYSIDAEAGLQLVGHERAFNCRILDLSLEGCCMRAEGRFPSHLRCQVEVTFKVNGLPFRLGGLIQRCSNSNEVGIRFVGVSARRMAEWGELVAEVEEDLAAKRARIGVAAARPQA